MDKPPRRASTVCAEPGCPTITETGSHCAAHTPPAWSGSTRRRRLPKNWERTRARILRRGNHRCYICGGRATEVDHINPGDDHSEANLAAICAPCHRSKSAREGRAARSR